MAMNEHGPLAEVGELAAQIGTPQTVLLDCRFSLLDTEAGRRSYDAGHIPGARYVHLDEDLAAAGPPEEGRHPLPPAEAFAATLGRLGVLKDSRVIAYDDAGGAIAARLWWMLRWLGHADVRVLNGGIQAWRAAGLGLEKERPAWSAVRYEFSAANDAGWIRTAELGDALSAGAQLVDARAAKRYSGEEEPIDAVAGHVPGAVNLPFSECLAADGRFLPAAALRALFADRLAATAGAGTVAMCGSGVTACHLLLALEHAALGGGRLYVSSWSGWIADPARPVGRGNRP